MSQLNDFDKKVDTKKEDDVYPAAIVNIPSKESDIGNMNVIESLIGGQFNIGTMSGSQILYALLDKKGHKKASKDMSYGGLGLGFHAATRHSFISDAFKIDDATKGVTGFNADGLHRLANAYKSGDISGLTKNVTKRMITLAIIAGYSSNVEYKREALGELKRLYKLPKFKNRDNAHSIRVLIRQMEKTLPILITPISEPGEKVKPVDTRIEPVLTKVEPVVKKDEPVATKVEPVATKVEPVSVKVNSVIEESALTMTHSKPATLPGVTLSKLQTPKQDNVMVMVVAIQKLLLENVDTWSQKTTRVLPFFGGIKIEHPDHKGVFVSLPNGIARMINILKSENAMTSGMVMEAEQAHRILTAICKVAKERAFEGHRSNVRYRETDNLYTLLSGVDSMKVTDEAIASIANILATQHVTKVNELSVR